MYLFQKESDKTNLVCFDHESFFWGKSLLPMFSDKICITLLELNYMILAKLCTQSTDIFIEHVGDRPSFFCLIGVRLLHLKASACGHRHQPSDKHRESHQSDKQKETFHFLWGETDPRLSSCWSTLYFKGLLSNKALKKFHSGSHVEHTEGDNCISHKCPGKPGTSRVFIARERQPF